MLTDTVGFFDYCIPLTNESFLPVADSLQKFYDYSLFNYITPPPAPKQLIQTTSVFKPHNLAPVHSGSLAITHQNADWITIVFLACLLIFAWIQTSYSKRLTQIFRAAAQPHFVNQLEREGNLFRERISLGLGFIYFSIISIFVFQLAREFNAVPSELSNMTFTGIIFAVLFLYQLVKTAIIHISGIIFNTGEAARQYRLNILIFNNIISVVLFPITIIAFYWNNTFLLIAGIITISLLFIYRFFRGILTGLNNKSYNLFYLFVYLCTLEILPLLLLFKVISKI